MAGGVLPSSGGCQEQVEVREGSAIVRLRNKKCQLWELHTRTAQFPVSVNMRRMWRGCGVGSGWKKREAECRDDGDAAVVAILWDCHAASYRTEPQQPRSRLSKTLGLCLCL